MKDGRNKIIICIFTAVLAALVIGLLYFMSVPQEKTGEGFLIRRGDEQIICQMKK